MDVTKVVKYHIEMTPEEANTLSIVLWRDALCQARSPLTEKAFRKAIKENLDLMEQFSIMAGNSIKIKRRKVYERHKCFNQGLIK